MRALYVLVLLLLVLQNLPPGSSGLPPGAVGENSAPEVVSFSLELEKEQDHYVVTVGTRIRGFVKARDPDGDRISTAMMNFTKVGEQLNMSFVLQEGDEPGSFIIDIPTDGWETGRYMMFIVLEDEHGARSIYEIWSELWLRMELPAPPGSDVWIYSGLVILSGLILVIAVAFSRAMEKRREHGLSF